MIETPYFFILRRLFDHPRHVTGSTSVRLQANKCSSKSPVAYQLRPVIMLHLIRLHGHEMLHIMIVLQPAADAGTSAPIQWALPSLAGPGSAGSIGQRIPLNHRRDRTRIPHQPALTRIMHTSKLVYPQCANWAAATATVIHLVVSKFSEHFRILAGHYRARSLFICCLYVWTCVSDQR